MQFKRSDFPRDFIFGAATAAYQIEGTSFGGCGRSHWDDFANTPGNIDDNSDGSVACDHYHRYGEDLDLMRVGNFDAYRFSVSWPRVLPDGRGAVNEEGLDFYDRLVDAQLARGLKPYMTLYHWDLPSPLADLGGWRNRDIAKWFADYARLVMSRLGDRVASTATFNEMWCIAWLSHFRGHHAPGLRDIRAAAHAMHNVLLAHGTALQALRADGARNLGVVLNLDHNAAATDDPLDVAAAAREDALFNRWFLEGIFAGSYPAEALEGLAPHMPKGWEQDMGLISAPIDSLGVNYYSRGLYAHKAGSLWPHVRGVAATLPTTDMGWEIYPEGLFQVLTRIDRDYTKGLPVFITENGMANADVVENGAVFDPERIAFLDAHLDAVRRAIAAGVNMQGYFCWSLLDNYEWAYGYTKRFGLVHVDYATQKRTPKASYFEMAKGLGR